MNKKISVLFVIVGLLMIGLVSGFLDILQTSPANTTTTDRTPDFIYTVTTDNSTTSDCNLTISGSTQALNVEVTNATAYTQTALRLVDGEYKWNVTCASTAGGATHFNTSGTWDLNVSFATYSATDLPAVAIDNIVGILAALFALASIIVLIVIFKWIKGSRGKLLVVK